MLSAAWWCLPREEGSVRAIKERFKGSSRIETNQTHHSRMMSQVRRVPGLPVLSMVTTVLVIDSTRRVLVPWLAWCMQDLAERRAHDTATAIMRSVGRQAERPHAPCAAHPAPECLLLPHSSYRQPTTSLCLPVGSACVQG